MKKQFLNLIVTAAIFTTSPLFAMEDDNHNSPTITVSPIYNLVEHWGQKDGSFALLGYSLTKEGKNGTSMKGIYFVTNGMKAEKLCSDEAPNLLVPLKALLDFKEIKDFMKSKRQENLTLKEEFYLSVTEALIKAHAKKAIEEIKIYQDEKFKHHHTPEEDSEFSDDSNSSYDGQEPQSLKDYGIGGVFADTDFEDLSL